MKYLKIFEEFNYDEHKHDEIDIIERVVVTFNNPGSQEVIEVEGILGEDKNQEHLWFKPLSEPLIFESSDWQKLQKDKEITYNQSHPHTQTAVKTLVDNIGNGNWMGISYQGERFNSDIDFGKIINQDGKGLYFIGTRKCIFTRIKFDKI
jgi:hypothetical protein